MTRAEMHHLRSLRDRGYRKASGLFVIEGEKVVGELLAANFLFEEIYSTPDWPDAKGLMGFTRIVQVTPSEMARISHFPTPSPVLAVGRIERRTLPPDELQHGLTLALDGVQDPGNVGTVLRIADWFGINRVLMSADSADLYNQKTINASMGSFVRVDAYTIDLAKALAGLAVASPRVRVLGCDLEGEDVHALPPLHEAVIVIGSEGRGLSPAVSQHLTQRITIPRYGRAESLNAAVAAGIVCDCLRRAGGGKPR